MRSKTMANSYKRKVGLVVTSFGNSADQTQEQEDEMDKIVFARIGAVCYVLWELVHYDAVYNVYHIALGVPLRAVAGR
jgi:hypothetical protein